LSHNIDESEAAYLEGLAGFKTAPLFPGGPSLDEVYIEQESYILPYNQWRGFKESKGIEIRKTEKFIRQVFFAKKQVGNMPHYHEKANIYQMLYIVGYPGVGKTTFIKSLAASIANDYMAGTEEHFPIYFKLRKHYKVEEIKEYFRDKHNLSLKKSKTYYFLFDNVCEYGHLAGEAIKQIVDEFRVILMERFPASRIVVATRPIEDTGGVFSLDIKNKNGKFLCLKGFTCEQVNSYIAKYRKYHRNIPANLCYSSICENFLSGEDTVKPLMLLMMLKLFESLDITINEKRNKTMLKAELYMRFLNTLSPSLVNSSANNISLNKKAGVFRNIIQKAAAIRQIENMTQGRTGISTQDVIQCSEPANDEVCQLVEDNNYNILSYYEENKELIEFNHISFQQYAVAEYLLSVFILNICGKENKAKLHIGYISDETIDFFAELVLLLRNSLTGGSKSIILKEFIHALYISDKNIAPWLSEDKAGFTDKTRVSEKILINAGKWLADETVYIASQGKSEKVFNITLNSRKNLPSCEHIFCERWYCLILLQMFQGALEDIYIGNMLRESLRTSCFNVYMLNFLGRTNLSGTDLRGAYLRNANMNRANLIGVDLSGTYLTGADLSGADLSGSRIYSTNLREANLSEANLSMANLRGTNLVRANLSRANMGKTKFYNADLSEADLRESYMESANLFKANLKDADLGGADIRGGYLNEINLRGANLFQTNLREADLSGANLQGAYLRNADLREAELKGAVLEETYLRGALLDGAHLRGTILEGKI